jgi:ribosomal protein S18 acetylase RimI-like enzyme
VSEFEVRPYDVRDRAELVALFGAAGEGAPSSEVWGHEQSLAEVYLTPYLDLEPASVFVAVVDGRPAGYLAGCVDETVFPGEEERTRAVISKYGLYRRPGPRRFFRRARYDTVLLRLRRQPVAGELADPRWPSHLHIDLLPVARGTGAAEQMMRAWFDRLLAVGSPGCYLQTSAENVRAIRYFERMGFRKHGPNPVVPGLRHEGRRMHQQTMVWTA